ncbi:glycosyltransferase [Vibrio vulnificus]|nr:glycosyltransferase [Vibrio vulnificus]EIZ1360377.1 glycosyltransferase [Vibrio vulnificus]
MSSNERVLILSHTPHNSVFKIGSHHYANNLYELGCSVDFIATPRSILHAFLSLRANEYISESSQLVDGVRVLLPKHLMPITVPRINIFSRLLDSYSSNFYKNLPFYDYVICDQAFFFPFLELLSYGRLVYRPTDIYEDLVGAKVSFFESKIISKADFVIPTSNKVKQHLERKYLLPTSTVIPNGYDSKKFFDMKNNNRSGFVYVGAIDKRFDFDSLFFLANKYHKDRFDIYGPIPESEVLTINNLKLICKNINFLGQVEYSSVPDILNRYSVGLLPFSNMDANLGRSPMKLYEYMACGLRVVYSNICSLTSSRDVIDISDIRSGLVSDDLLKSAIVPFTDSSNSWESKSKFLLSFIQGK